jgi:hypothetical protein
MKQIDLREGARRQHRAVALVAVVQCWLRGLDGIVFDRRHLERLPGLKRFKRTRVGWLQEDFAEFFPFQEVYWLGPGSLGSVFLARMPIEDALPGGRMSDEQRIAGIPPGGPKLALFQIWSSPNASRLREAFDGLVPFFSDRANFDERFLSAYLALMAQGQISPRKLPPLREIA